MAKDSKILSGRHKAGGQSPKCALDCGRGTGKVRGRGWLHGRVAEGSRKKQSIRSNGSHMVVVGSRDS